MTADELDFNGFKHKWQAIIVQPFFDFFVAFSKFLLPYFLIPKVDIVQFLQLEPYAANANLIRAFVG